MMEQAHDPDQQIAERYFLGELTNSEAEAFEAHYFECASCAEYVREEQMLLDLGRKIAFDDKPAPVAVPPPVPIPVPMPVAWQWRQWIPPAAAAAMLVVAIVLRNPTQQQATSRMVHAAPASPTSEILHSEQFLMSADRAEGSTVKSFAIGAPVSLDIDVPPSEQSFPAYALFTRNTTTGAVIKRHELSSGEVNDPITLLLRDLPAGSYEVVIEGVRKDGKRSPITTRPFEVRVKQQGENP